MRTVFGDGCSFHNSYINPFVVFLVFCVEAVHQIHRKHAQVLIEEVDVAIIDTLCNLFTDLAEE